MKRILAFILVLAIMLCALISCGGRDSNTDEGEDSKKNTYKFDDEDEDKEDDDDAVEDDENDESENLEDEFDEDETEVEVVNKEETNGSEKLKFKLNIDQKSYTLLGTLDETITDLIIDKYNDLPITKIEDSAFKYCGKLKTVTIADGLTSIGKEAFRGCTKLTSVTIPDGVTKIGEDAFWCAGLTSVNLPRSVESIAKNAFGCCENLESIKVDDNNPIYKDIDGSLYTKDGKTLIQYAVGRKFGAFVIPDGVTNISDYAFAKSMTLTSLTIPKSVTALGESAFSSCTRLVEVINKSALIIKRGSYYDSKIANAVIEVHSGESKLVNKSGYLFYTYQGVNYLVNYIGTDKKIKLPANYNGEKYAINWCVFEGNDNIRSVTIPDGVTGIDGSAFEECLNLRSVTIPDSITSIPYRLFASCSSLESVTLPDSITDIEQWAFYGCLRLTSVTIPSSVKKIGPDAFEECRNLVTIINESSCVIDNFCLNDIRPFVVQKGKGEVVTKGEYVFYIYEGVNYLLGYVGKDTDLILPKNYNGENYVINDNAFFRRTGLTSVTISEGVTDIGDSAFYECKNLTSVTMSGGLKNIGDHAFELCTALTSITIPNSVTNIGKNAFHDCHSLKSVIIGNGVTSIGEQAFSTCVRLTSVIIGNGVTSIGERAFLSCDSLTSINYRGTEEQWNAISKGTLWTSSNLSSCVITYNYTGE